MANVFVAFYNCMHFLEDKDPNAMPAFYETFINGLEDMGNTVMVSSQKSLGVISYPTIDCETSKKIKQFAPDICFLFNNCFFDISEIVDCPIVVYEVDSPNLYVNREILKTKKDRFIHFIFQTSSRKILNTEFGIEDKYIFDVPFFTEIRPEECEIKRNIGFIGTNFVQMNNSLANIFYSEKCSIKDRLIYNKMLDIVELNPNCDVTVIRAMLDAMDAVKDGEGIEHTVKQSIMLQISGEKRIQLLGTILPLGLEIFGTENWNNQYYANSKLNRSYNFTPVYSKYHNQSIYNSSKIGINVSHIQAVSGFPWRIMDILASNACLVTDYHEDFKTVFGDIIDYIPLYDNPGEAYALCKKLIEDEELRKHITSICQEFVDKRYRFINCLRMMEQYSGVSLSP